MAQGNEGNDNRNDVVCSERLTEETTNNQRQRLAAGTLTCPPEPELPALPFDLLPEILCRLPVRLLVQLRCLCKFFNSLISDPNFAKKHLHMSTKRHHLMLTNENMLMDDSYELVLFLYDSPIPLLFSTSTVFTETRLYLPSTLTDEHHCEGVLCCCDGIFCGMLESGSYFLWNPSITKFKLLPHLEIPHVVCTSFGYDHFIDNYKVIVVSSKNEVSVNTLGTDYWTRIEDIPTNFHIHSSGIFVSGTVNWLPSDSSMHFILSLDLEKESYQQLLLPNSKNDSSILGLVRDCLCVFASSDEYLDVWIMKEYGNQESWAKLYTIHNLQVQNLEGSRALYISEDDQLLVKCYELHSGDMKLVVYDPKTGTSNIPEFQNICEDTNAIVYIESLISP